MRLGCCGSIEDADTFRQAGFDYLEVNAQQVLRGEEDDEAWAADAPDPDALLLPIEAANALLPAHLPIVGKDRRDTAALGLYLRRVTERAAALGIRRLVFGSGAARRRPEGVTQREAADDLMQFCRMAGELCAERGILLVVEQLNRKETNTLNKLKQVARLVERTNHPAVAALIDSYHFARAKEPDEAITALAGQIRHVHVAEPGDRRQPGAPAEGEGFDFQHLFCLLHKAGYDERVSVEARWSAPVDEVAPACVRRLREAWDAAAEATC